MALVTTLHAVGNWIYWFFGFSGTGSHYGAWSGALSDVGEVTLIGLVAAGLRHANCHASGCWRVGRHHVEGTPFKVCRKHHPTIPDGGVSAEHIRAAYWQPRDIPVGVPAHKQTQDHRYVVAFPEHGARSQDPHYADFEAWKRKHQDGAKCWVGERIGSDQCTLDQPLEVHHAVIEWSLINGVDFAALEKDYPGISDPSKVGEWVDSADPALRFLCQFHHRGHGGAHVASHSDWTAQAYVKDLLS